MRNIAASQPNGTCHRPPILKNIQAQSQHRHPVPTQATTIDWSRAMTTSAEYRKFAFDCMREAESADDAAMRLTMVGMARIWMDVALELDKHVMRASGQGAPNDDRKGPHQLTLVR